MKNLKQDIEEINQTISNNRGEIKRPDMTLFESGFKHEALSDTDMGTKSWSSLNMGLVDGDGRTRTVNLTKSF